MFCNNCRTEFKPWTNKHGWQVTRQCKTCYPKNWFPPKERKNSEHYCIYCGSVLPVKIKKHKSGKEYTCYGQYKYCAACKPLPVKALKKCVVCGVDLIRAHKYCPDHKPQTVTVNRVKHSRKSMEWQKNNPEKVKAQRFARYRPDLVYVLYECRCEAKRKHNHHFNYELKNIVLRLCPACHSAEHKRLRRLPLPDSNISVSQ